MSEKICHKCKSTNISRAKGYCLECGAFRKTFFLEMLIILIAAIVLIIITTNIDPNVNFIERDGVSIIWITLLGVLVRYVMNIDAQRILKMNLKKYPISTDGNKTLSDNNKVSSNDLVIGFINSSIADIENCIKRGELVPYQSYRNKGIVISKFNSGFMDNFTNHINLLKHLRKNKKLSLFKIFSIELNEYQGLCGLIIIEGKTNNIASFSKIYYLPEAESFVNNNLSGNWNKLNANSTISDTPENGYGVDLIKTKESLISILNVISDLNIKVRKI